MSEVQRRSRRADVLLALGAAAGLIMAAASVLERAPDAPGADGGELPAGVVAEVNGVQIARADYDASLAIEAAGRREPMSDDQKRAVLEKLIDEELLIEEAIGLGVTRHEDALRSGLITAMRESVVAAALAEQPTDADVAAFYQANAGQFARVTTAHLRQVWVGGAQRGSMEAALLAAQEAARRLRGGVSFADVTAALGDRPALSIPDELAHRADLQKVIGPTAAERAFALAGGGVTDPVQRGEGYIVVEVVKLGPSEMPPLPQVEARVRSEMGRRTQEQAIRDHVRALRDAAEIRVGRP